MTSPIQEIKDRLDIVDFIRSYVPLQAAGKNFKANCPFHREKTPSFIVSPERQTWHCFGACGEGGDIFKFLMKYENLEFYEALKILAEKAGVELKKTSPAEHKQFGILYDINHSAKEFFIRQLREPVGKEVLDYLEERGLKKEIIEEFEIGFAPAGFDDLTRHLTKSGYNIKDVERAGLNFKTERGIYVDKFRGRIMFPLCNHFGKTVGFSGRLTKKEESRVSGQGINLAKYVNSPETLIFNKSRILYGFHKTKNHIRSKSSALVVEGQIDLLMLYQQGLQNVVATSGTALTADHLKTMRRLTDKLVLCFDSDEAGFNAAERAIDLAGAADFNVSLLVLNDFKDPAEAAQQSPETLSKLIGETKPAMEFYFGRYLGEKIDLPGFKRNLRIILGKIKALASPVERSYWIKELSQKTKMEERTLAEEMEQLKNEKPLAGEQNKVRDAKRSMFNTGQSRRELISQRLIGMMVAKDDLKMQINEHFEYFPEDYLAIFRHLDGSAKLEDERLRNLLDLISSRSSLESPVFDEEKTEKEFQELLRQLQLEFLREKRQKLVGLIKEAQEKSDETKIFSVLKEFDEVSKSIQNI